MYQLPSNWPDTRYLCSGVIEGLYEQEPDKLQVFVWLSFVTSQHDRCFHSQGCTQNQIEAQRTGSIWNGGAAAGARSDFCKKVGASDITLAPTWWRRGELNSRPKTHPQELLRAQTVIAGVLLSPFPSPRASRHARGLGELHDAWHAQSLAYSRPPLNDA